MHDGKSNSRIISWYYVGTIISNPYFDGWNPTVIYDFGDGGSYCSTNIKGSGQVCIRNLWLQDGPLRNLGRTHGPTGHFPQRQNGGLGLGKYMVNRLV